MGCHDPVLGIVLEFAECGHKIYGVMKSHSGIKYPMDRLHMHPLSKHDNKQNWALESNFSITISTNLHTLQKN